MRRIRKKEEKKRCNRVNHNSSLWPKVKTGLYYAWGIKGDLNELIHHLTNKTRVMLI